MIPFIVRGKIEMIPYLPNSPTQKFLDLRIVMAEDEEEAENKYEKYWEHQEDKYSDVFKVMGMEVMETLL